MWTDRLNSTKSPAEHFTELSENRVPDDLITQRKKRSGNHYNPDLLKILLDTDISSEFRKKNSWAPTPKNSVIGP